MLKVELEKKMNEYKEIIREISCWAFPQQYKLDVFTNKDTMLRHIEGIQKVLKQKYYKEEE